MVADKMPPADELRIVNCHAHIFTAEHVPPYLGKTLMPFPFPYIISIRAMIALVSSSRKGFLRYLFYSIKTPVDRFIFGYQRLTEHVLITKVIAWFIKFLLTLLNTLFLLSFLRNFFTEKTGLVRQFLDFVFTNSFLTSINSVHWLLKVAVLALSLILLKWVRNIAKFLVFSVAKFLKEAMGSGTVQLLKRYYNIAVLCRYKKQHDIYKVLVESYPANTQFVILPMDLDYAQAGKPRKKYMEQLEELTDLKRKDRSDNLKPFVFADPRRIEEDPSYYDKIIDCLENENFSGIKIYPALGYYPFDKNLLELFFYACQKEIPIMTHCIRGIIFYRGIKKKEWDFHPVFTETTAGPDKMKLKQFSNIDYINNFTHPLNFLCLLDPDLLKEVLFDLPGKSSSDAALRDKLYKLYGFVAGTTAASSTLEHTLQNLKICFGHFGGEDEWSRYLSNDRSTYDNHYSNTPTFFHPYKTALCAHWTQETWYSIIRSIIMNPAYPNIYADISFIIYDAEIISLLKSSLQVNKLKEHILYGTDFYVVRQKGTDKKFWTDISAHLSINELDMITKYNPYQFLKNKLKTKKSQVAVISGQS